MIPVHIDISPILEEFSDISGRGGELSSYLVDKIIETYMSKWHDIVKNNLKGTRRAYIRAMNCNKIDDYNAVISLIPGKDPVPMIVEEGISSFDMKSGFSKSLKAKRKPDGGWYLTIPFRHATTEALAESTIFSNILPKKIQNISKKLNRAISSKDLPEEYRKIGMNKTSKYKHKSSIYSGLKRFEVGAGKEKRGEYMTFRRVSDNSDPGAFIHSGISAHKFMERALHEANIDRVVDLAIDEFLSER